MSQSSFITVKDVMKEKFDLVEGVATVRQALEVMRHVETKCLIVDKRDDHDEYGIVVIADIARKVLAVNRSPDRVSIYEVMTKPAVTVHPDMG
ncbi:MAG TPA: CBS domain-containing protein, partial [Mariprofundaceae bacterium]|nr:CBS domain-containing protein [Mariprofundaceae bacterium]